MAGYRAWVIRWEWAGDHAARDKPFVSVALIRWQRRRVAEWVEGLYATLSYSDDEIVEALRGVGHNTIRIEPDGAQ